jgi:hypothetical protein
MSRHRDGAIFAFALHPVSLALKGANLALAGAGAAPAARCAATRQAVEQNLVEARERAGRDLQQRAQDRASGLEGLGSKRSLRLGVPMIGLPRTTCGAVSL